MGTARHTEGFEHRSFAKGVDGREFPVSRRSFHGQRAEESRIKRAGNREDGDHRDGGTDDDNDDDNDDDDDDDHEDRGWDVDGDVVPF